ncbi:MAG TPA: glycosyltransferase family 4 protein [Pirellulales bacterium]|nr:glycosyltransferase family 4 protein [Pirellulales bacterium]
MNQSPPTKLAPSIADPSRLDGHVVILTNYIPPHALPVYVELAERVKKLTMLLSTPMEPNRKWQADWSTLEVKLQRTLTLERPWRHPFGFRESMSVHVPWDTCGQLRSLRPDVVLSAQFGLRSLLAACYSSLARKPLVLWVNVTEHQEQGRGRIRHLLRRWLIRRSTAIAVNSRSGMRYLRTLGADPARVFYVPYSAVPRLHGGAALARPAELSHRLLYVGQLVERKGLQPFLEVLVRWAGEHPARTVEFDLAGSGPLEHELRALPLPANLRLNFLGERNFDQLADCYARAGILAFPTLSDEWGLVVNEALATGLPVLGSTYSEAVDELCVEGETGWRFRTDVADEMYQAVDRAFNASHDKLEQMRRAGCERVKSLTPAFAAQRFMETIRFALGETPYAASQALRDAESDPSTWQNPSETTGHEAGGTNVKPEIATSGRNL